MDDYMFGAVMQDPDLLKPLIEATLGFAIREIRYIESQMSVKNGYDFKGVRLDLYVEDERGAVYNVEVQTTRQHDLPRRIRYYQSSVDQSILKPGMMYSELRDTYIIFICNHDPFGANRYVYRFENRCIEDLALRFGDGTVKVVVNTRGSAGTASQALREVIRYLNDGQVCGSYSRALDDAVKGVKASNERRQEFMNLMMHEQDIRNQALAQGMAQGMAKGMAQGMTKGMAQGKLQGHQEAMLMSIRKVMQKASCTAKEAMDYLDIPASDQEWYMKVLMN